MKGSAQKLMLVKVVFVLLTSSLVYSQDACMRLTAADLGRTDMLDASGIISDILAPGGEITSSLTVRVLDINIVCEAQHMMENRYRYTSVVVSFNCETTDPRVPQCANSSVINIEQFDLGCVGGQWTPTILTISNEASTTNPTANLTTELDTGCILCINPTHPAATGMSVDNVTHCVACSNCPMGLQRCYYEGTSTNEVCCNYFNEEACVEACPSPLVPSTSNNCVACEDVLRNCMSCAVNGQDVTCTSCQPGLTLRNGACETQTGSNLCGTGCIVGIVVGVIILLLLILTVAIIIGIACRRSHSNTV